MMWSQMTASTRRFAIEEMANATPDGLGVATVHLRAEVFGAIADALSVVDASNRERVPWHVVCQARVADRPVQGLVVYCDDEATWDDWPPAWAIPGAPVTVGPVVSPSKIAKLVADVERGFTHCGSDKFCAAKPVEALLAALARRQC